MRDESDRPMRTNYQRKQAFPKKAPRSMSDRYLVDELDAITSLIVRAQESVCFIVGCEKRDNLECGHLLERRHRHTRWDTTLDGNCHAQCHEHNQEHERDSRLYVDSYIERFGERAYDEMVWRSRNNQKLVYSDLLNLLEEKQKQFSELRRKIA